MSAETEKILQRVRKMLALAADAAASEGERDTALAMAHKTLAHYNLSISQVQDLPGSTAHDPRVKEEFDLMADARWAATAANGVGNLFFCKYLHMAYPHSGDKHAFIGKSVNVATATYMAEYVIRSIAREAEEAHKTYVSDTKLNALFDFDGDTRPEAPKGAWIAAFCAAAAQVVAQRCRELREASERQNAQGAGTGTSLVIIYKSELDANMDFIRNKLGLNIGHMSAGRYRDVGSARSAGTSYGASINLSQQIGNSSATKRLK